MPNHWAQSLHCHHTTKAANPLKSCARVQVTANKANDAFLSAPPPSGRQPAAASNGAAAPPAAEALDASKAWQSEDVIKAQVRAKMGGWVGVEAQARPKSAR